MPAVCHQLNIEQGSTLRQVLRWRDDDGTYRDLTGYSGELLILDAEGGEYLHLTSENDEVLFDADGYITIVCVAETTLDLQPLDGLRFDLHVTDTAGERIKVMFGPAYLIPQLPR